MDRMLPAQTAEPMVRGSGGAAAFRGTLYALMCAVLLSGAWLRFNQQIAAVVPGLRAPDMAQQGASPGEMKALVEMAMLAPGEAASAVPGMGLSNADANRMLQAMRDGRLRLIAFPMVDVSTADDGGDGGHRVLVSSAGYSRVVQLTREPVVVTLPVAEASSVAFAPSGQAGAEICTRGLSGPLCLRPLNKGDVVDLGIIPQ